MENLVVNSGLIADGSVDQGKHYNRALHLYKLLYEALARIVIKRGEEECLLLPGNLKDFIDIIGEYSIQCFVDLGNINLFINDSYLCEVSEYTKGKYI